MAEKKLDKKTEECIEACVSCYQTCVRTKMHCIEKGGDHAEKNHLALLSICAEACKLSTHAMLIESEFQGKICGICADICTRCATDCETFRDDEIMQTCADVCRQCASACREMS